jgi:hypothetical protein
MTGFSSTLPKNFAKFRVGPSYRGTIYGNSFCYATVAAAYAFATTAAATPTQPQVTVSAAASATETIGFDSDLITAADASVTQGCYRGPH